MKDDNSSNELRQGLFTLLKNTSDQALSVQPFFSLLMKDWASELPGTTYKAARSKGERASVIRERQHFGDNSIEAMEREAAEYFARLFYWSTNALQGEGLSFLEFESDTYRGLYSVMDKLKSREVEVSKEPEDDNALVRLLRGAMTGMVKEQMKRTPGKPRGNNFSLIGTNGRVRILINSGQIQNILAREGLNLTHIPDEYIRTLLPTNGQSN